MGCASAAQRFVTMGKLVTPLELSANAARPQAHVLIKNNKIVAIMASAMIGAIIVMVGRVRLWLCAVIGVSTR